MATRGVNKVILIGNLGVDPEVRYTQSGDPVTNLRLATSEAWRDKTTGELQERTEWHRVVLFGKVADVAGKYLKKGSKVYIEGQLHTRKWQAQDGTDRYSTEVVVRDFNGSMQMLDSRPGGGTVPYDAGAPQPQSQPQSQGYADPAMAAAAPTPQPPPTPSPAPAPAPAPAQSAPAPAAPAGQPDFDDDIPF